MGGRGTRPCVVERSSLPVRAHSLSLTSLTRSRGFREFVRAWPVPTQVVIASCSRPPSSFRVGRTVSGTSEQAGPVGRVPHTPYAPTRGVSTRRLAP